MMRVFSALICLCLCRLAVYLLYNPHGIRFSTRDIFIRDDLILMKASVTHSANLCNSLHTLCLEGKWQANKPIMFRWDHRGEGNTFTYVHGRAHKNTRLFFYLCEDPDLHHFNQTLTITVICRTPTFTQRAKPKYDLKDLLWNVHTYTFCKSIFTI